MRLYREFEINQKDNKASRDSQKLKAHDGQTDRQTDGETFGILKLLRS